MPQCFQLDSIIILIFIDMFHSVCHDVFKLIRLRYVAYSKGSKDPLTPDATQVIYQRIKRSTSQKLTDCLNFRTTFCRQSDTCHIKYRVSRDCCFSHCPLLMLFQSQTRYQYTFIRHIHSSKTDRVLQRPNNTLLGPCVL